MVLPLNPICVCVCPQIPEEVFEEVLLSALQTDLASAFSTPEQLQLLLVALQRFPQTLKPKKLKKLLGSSTIINAENIPKYDLFFFPLLPSLVSGQCPPLLDND